MKCERCEKQHNLLRFFDEVTDSGVTLCRKCFDWFANGRRKGGLPVPNTRPVYASYGRAVAVSLSLCLVLGLAACSDDHGGETVNPQGGQKCTVTLNGQEKPCH